MLIASYAYTHYAYPQFLLYLSIHSHEEFFIFLLLSEYFDSNGPVTISIPSSDHRGNYYILSHDQQLLSPINYSPSVYSVEKIDGGKRVEMA